MLNRPRRPHKQAARNECRGIRAGDDPCPFAESGRISRNTRPAAPLAACRSLCPNNSQSFPQLSWINRAVTIPGSLTAAIPTHARQPFWDAACRRTLGSCTKNIQRSPPPRRFACGQSSQGYPQSGAHNSGTTTQRLIGAALSWRCSETNGSAAASAVAWGYQRQGSPSCPAIACSSVCSLITPRLPPGAERAR